MKFKEKLKYISNRALVLGTVIFGVIIVLAVIQLLLAYKGETPWWMAIIITIFAILFPIVFWLWIHRPYMRCEKMTDRFLDGYIFSEKEDMELLNLTPSIQKQMKMVERIVRSPQYMDLNKRQAQYLALQNQINPHFLYNTLDSVVWMTENGRTQEAVAMLTALARFFRISLSKGSSIIPIGDELEHARNYLAIQKMRYKNKFSTDISVEQGVERLYTVKLIIQPILENAIYHGMEYADGDGEIHIRAFREGENMVIEVEDNGPGMPEQVVEQLLNPGISVSAARPGGSGIGLRNVHQRIQLTFGPAYGLTIRSEPDRGTVVRICLPALGENEVRKYRREGEA